MARLFGWLRRRGWRTQAGIVATTIWLGLVLGYAFGVRGVDALNGLAPNALGDFAAGAAAPFAFFWLVVGYLQQGHELRQNVEALRLQAEEMKRAADNAALQAEGIKINAQHSRRDIIIKSNEIILVDLNHIASEFAMRSQLDNRDRLWHLYGSGDRYIMFQAAETILKGNEHEVERVLRRQGGNGFISRYCDLYEYLLQQSEEADPGGLIGRTYKQTPVHAVYVSLCARLQREPKL